MVQFNLFVDYICCHRCLKLLESLLSMKYAIVQIGGMQVRLEEGATFVVNKMTGYTPLVLMYSNGESVEVGSPFLEGVTIDLSVVGEKTLKTQVKRFKAKSRYRKNTGHKQPLVTLKVDSIGKKGEKKAVTEEKVEVKPVEKKVKAKKEATN